MVTIKIDERTKAGKTFLEIAKIFSREKKGVEIVKPAAVSKGKTFPVSKNIPNAETEEIMKENDRKGTKRLKKFSKVEDLIAELNS